MDDCVTPISTLMGAFGALVLIANLACLRLLWPLRSQDVNMRSTFECSRNGRDFERRRATRRSRCRPTGRAWPDILVGAVVAVLFLRSAVSVLRESWPQVRGGSSATPLTHP